MSKKISISLIFFAILLVGLWIWTLAMPNSSISIGGSSSADPVIQRLTNKYKKSNGNSFIYSSTGSQAGISNMENGVYKVGFISKSVDKNDNEQDKWTNDFEAYNNKRYTSSQAYYKYLKTPSEQGVHYATFAKDSLVFIYNDTDLNFEAFEPLLKIGFSSLTKMVDDPTHKILKSIYDQENPNNLITWRELAQELANNNPDSGIKPETINQVSDKKVIPFSTAPGSGTRSSFATLAGSADQTLEPGAATHIYPSNGAVFSQIRAAQGTFGYVSMSYAKYLANGADLGIKYIKVLEDNTKLQDPIELYSKDNGSQLGTYGLTREFNAIFDTSKLSDKELGKVANFIYYISLDKGSDEALHEEGLIKWYTYSTSGKGTD